MFDNDYSDLIGIRFTPYGRTKEEGFDCYGLVKFYLKRHGIELYDITYDFEKRINARKEIFATNKSVVLDKPEIDCVIEMRIKNEPTHVGVYVGEGKILHAVEGLGVIIDSIERKKEQIVGYYRVCNN